MTSYSTTETTKSKIINAAGVLAAEHGIDNVSTRAVAELSGENLGSIHYHFGSKDGLFIAMARECISQGGLDSIKSILESVNSSPSRKELSKTIRQLIVAEIDNMFRSKRPAWQLKVSYQLLQREDYLYDLLKAEVFDPSVKIFNKFFRFIDPNMNNDESFIHILSIKMPVLAHVNYSKAILAQLGKDTYPETYLVKLENILVRQTQLVLGLPTDQRS